MGIIIWFILWSWYDDHHVIYDDDAKMIWRSSCDAILVAHQRKNLDLISFFFLLATLSFTFGHFVFYLLATLSFTCWPLYLLLVGHFIFYFFATLSFTFWPLYLLLFGHFIFYFFGHFIFYFLATLSYTSFYKQVVRVFFWGKRHLIWMQHYI